MYTCTVNWFCVHLYSQLVICTLVQSTCFVYTCTFNWFCVHLNFVCVSMLAQILHKVGTLIVQSLHADCIKFAQGWSASKSNLSWAAHKNHRSAYSLICPKLSHDLYRTWKHAPLSGDTDPVTIQHEALCDNLISPDSGALNLGERGEKGGDFWLVGGISRLPESHITSRRRYKSNYSFWSFYTDTLWVRLHSLLYCCITLV